MRVRVYHALFGCETGCCGHIVELGDESASRSFRFVHPYDEEVRSWAMRLAQEVVRQEWPQCYDTIDWASLECDEAGDL